MSLVTFFSVVLFICITEQEVQKEIIFVDGTSHQLSVCEFQGNLFFSNKSECN